MQRIVGPGAYDQHGKGNVNVGDGGVAFLLASAGTIPGGAPLVGALPPPPPPSLVHAALQPGKLE